MRHIGHRCGGSCPDAPGKPGALRQRDVLPKTTGVVGAPVGVQGMPEGRTSASVRQYDTIQYDTIHKIVVVRGQDVSTQTPRAVSAVRTTLPCAAADCERPKAKAYP
jgi:hypothetical protein